MNGKIKIYKIASYDIETDTSNNMNNFLFGGFIDGNGLYKCFTDKDKMIEYMEKHVNKDTWVYATNNSFDHYALFGHRPDFLKEPPLMRGNLLINAKYHNINTFDTRSYCKANVESLGLMLGKPKGKGDFKFYNKELLIKKHRQIFRRAREYNKRDCEISREFMIGFQKVLNELGGNLKLTIGSCAMDLFKRQYLQTDIQHEYIKKFRDGSFLKDFLSEAYHGGRTETFKKSLIGFDTNKDKIYYYYDFNCYSHDTEILTTKGFKKFWELDKNDIVFSMFDDKLEKQIIHKLEFFEYQGELINLTNENTDQLVTPNHRVYYKDYNRSKKGKEYKTWSHDWKVKESKDIPKTYIKFPNAKIYNGNLLINKNLLKICAWFITEGHINKYGMIEISQSWFHNKEKCERILKIFEESGIEFRALSRIQKGKKYLYINFRKEFIEKYFENINMNSYSMRLIKDFIELTYEQKKILFEELMLGDGCYQKGKTTYISYSEELLNDFQILTTMIGLKSSITNNVVNIKLNRSGDSQIDKKDYVKYKNYVWCVSVDFKNVVVRRNGKVFISGNSLYPSVMLNAYPKPSSCQLTMSEKGNLNISSIINFEGCSKIKGICPHMNYPVLPMVVNKKLCFVCGKIDGVFTHVELRKFLEVGGIITKIYKTACYTETFKPFEKWVTDLYNLRLKYSTENNIIYKEIIKLYLNNLSGKFFQRNIMNMEFININDRNDDDLSQEGFTFDRAIGFGYRETPKESNQAFIIPIFAVYTTSFARLKLYDKLVELNGFVCDTDSILTDKKISYSKNLGDVKLEFECNQIEPVKPKFYRMFDKTNNKWVYKAKGVRLGRSDDIDEDNKIKDRDWNIIRKGEKLTQIRYSSIKESIRSRGKFKPNEIRNVFKQFDNTDDKRVWTYEFDLENGFDENGLALSEPMIYGFKHKDNLDKYYQKLKSKYSTVRT
jgi:hypothetical protein